MKPYNFPLNSLSQGATYAECSNFLSSEECHKLKKLMKHPQKALIEGKGNGAVDKDSIRNATLYGIAHNTSSEWIYKKLQDVACHMNNDLWHMDLNGLYEGIQVVEYKTKGHYDWHMDIGAGALSQRKLSIVIQLSDDSDYTGGELEFFGVGKASRQQGTLMIFPSYMVHRVLPVESGTRHSLVAWVSGNPYR